MAYWNFYSSKLRTYCLFKTTFEIENYLFIYNKNHRQALSRFRLSAHNLEIEKGRWRRILVNGRWRSIVIPVEERFCLFCSNNDVESEHHVLMSCNKYLNLRLELFNHARQYIENFDTLDKATRFVSILQITDSSLQQQLGKYIYLIFKRRSEHENVNAGHNINIPSINNCISVNSSTLIEKYRTMYLYWYGRSIKVLYKLYNS
jgi:hypothetical protein